VFSNWNIRTLFIISALGVIVRWGLTASTTALVALVAIQSLHGVTFALAHIATIKYIQHAPQHKMVALQALYNAIPERLGLRKLGRRCVLGNGVDGLTCSVCESRITSITS